MLASSTHSLTLTLPGSLPQRNSPLIGDDLRARGVDAKAEAAAARRAARDAAGRNTGRNRSEAPAREVSEEDGRLVDLWGEAKAKADYATADKIRASMRLRGLDPSLVLWQRQVNKRKAAKEKHDAGEVVEQQAEEAVEAALGGGIEGGIEEQVDEFAYVEGA